MGKIRVALLIAVLIIYVACDDKYIKVIHNTDPDAKCLDGSSPMIYLNEGGDTKNILIHMLGGGACLGNDLSSTLQSCYKRSKGQFGSSTVWPDTYKQENFGILTTDLSRSKFANWTKIVIMYCDGAFHQGNNKNAIQYKDRKLYFRGALNTRSHLKYIDQKYNLNGADKIVFTGSSAGGIATYLWVDYVRSLVSNPNKVYGIVDSGIFVDPFINFKINEEWDMHTLQKVFVNYENQDVQNNLRDNDDPNPIQILMQLSNVDQKPPNKACSDLLTPEQNWKCIFIQFSYPTQPSKLLFVESSYDQFVIEAALQFKCLKKGKSGYTPSGCADWQINVMEVYRDFYIQRFLPKLLKYGHSIWTISCVWHAGMIEDIYDSPLQKVPKDTGRTMRSAVESYVFEDKRIEAIDFFSWPANTPCAY